MLQKILKLLGDIISHLYGFLGWSLFGFLPAFGMIGCNVMKRVPDRADFALLMWSIIYLLFVSLSAWASRNERLTTRNR